MICEYCKRKFAREKTLINHPCEKKRRWFEKDNPPNRVAFIAYVRFYELSSNKNESKSFSDFVESKLYNAFMRFGSFIIDNDIVKPDKFIDYAIKANIPMKYWTDQTVIQVFVQDLYKNESIDQAVQRSFENMKRWASETDLNWNEYFKLANPNRIIRDLRSGRLSPWVIYNLSWNYFDKCNKEQENLIKSFAPMKIWKIKFQFNKDDRLILSKSLEESGI